jgi:opine dehydrogenase
MLKITIIGAGHGGLALAAHLARQGCRVTLCADAEHPGFIHKVMANDGEIELMGRETGIARIAHLTHNYAEAVSHTQLIILSTPSYAHEPVFRKLLPFLKSDHIVITLAGNFSAIVLNSILNAQGHHQHCTLADISSLPYACRVDETGYRVQIMGIKKQMGIATLPAHKAPGLQKSIQRVFPTQLIPYQNVLEIGLNITSGISHPISALFNAGRIGSDKPSFYFYKEGISEHTAVLLEQLDADRRAIGKAYGLSLSPYLQLMEEFYGNKFDNIHEFFQKTPVHNQQKLCPRSLQERYIGQDVPYVIVPWYCLGKKVGLESTLMRNIIEISSLINDTDYLAEGRNHQALGLDGFSIQDYIAMIEGSDCDLCRTSAA